MLISTVMFMLRVIMERVNLEWRDCPGDRCMWGRLETVRLLLEYEVDVDRRDYVSV